MPVSSLHQGRPRSGFTLIELLVVVSIIAVLIAILVPSLAAAKKHARKVDNQSLLNRLAQAAEQYESVFHAYPGQPGGEVYSGRMSGTQGLLLSMSYPWVAIGDAAPNDRATVFGTTAMPPIVLFTDGPWTIYVDPTNSSGPIDHGNPGPTGRFHGMGAFFTPLSNDISPPTTPGGNQWPEGGCIGAATDSGSFAFPTLLDHYPIPMPILYFRGRPGVTGTVQFDSSGNVTANSLVGKSRVITDKPTTFCVYDNLQYTESTGFFSAAGRTPDQHAFAPIASGFLAASGGDDTVQTNNLAVLLTGKGVNQTLSPKGTNFVLLSAGEDRLYGTADDIIVIR